MISEISHYLIHLIFSFFVLFFSYTHFMYDFEKYTLIKYEYTYEFCFILTSGREANGRIWNSLIAR